MRLGSYENKKLVYFSGCIATNTVDYTIWNYFSEAQKNITHLYHTTRTADVDRSSATKKQHGSYDITLYALS